VFLKGKSQGSWYQLGLIFIQKYLGSFSVEGSSKKKTLQMANEY